MANHADQVERAEALANQILELARAHNNKALLETASDPQTEVLLAVLPPEVARQAGVHLEGALIWKTKQNGRARDKLKAAAKALDQFDLVLAKGILRKIDTAVLGENELERYDELALALEARAMEFDQLDAQVGEVKDEKRKRRRWR